jgi:hypothetical protein
MEWFGWNVDGVTAFPPARAALLAGVAEPPVRA